MDQVIAEIKFVKLALGSFEDFKDEIDRNNYLKWELSLVDDESIKQQLKG